ncbi:MAG: TonB-dependent receptor [Acidobacteria bacterium]|nr:TonB-dependent receptor [Acidobacteriota bacterium]
MSSALMAVDAHAQLQSGSITGVITDSSGGILPGVTVSLSGDTLIGGTQTQISDGSGRYRFDRLPPGSYRVRIELQGFKTVDRAGILVSASFVVTLNEKLEVGSVSETIIVTGESPTVDIKSNVQQTVMTQAILEGVPTGRDPWSVAKLIPGVQVATYDVGGTQSIQQSSLSSHGSSTNDVNYNIDGAVVNWPGGGGGATMLYYDQGMFEEVNYMTSAIPAEVMVGGLSINMVTKDAGNRWKGDARYSYSSGCLTPSAPTPGCLESDNLQSGIDAGVFPKLGTDGQPYPGNPTKTTYDFNVAGGGALLKDRLWVNGSYRYWIVDKLVNSRNLDKTQALDDNTLKNYSGKAVFSASANQKWTFSYNWNNKIRGHRRDSNDTIPDIAALVQTNPASSTQAKYTGIRNRLVFESSFSNMDGQTNYMYQPDTPATAIRVEDSTLGVFNNAATRHEEQPNSRLQFDNTVTYNATGLGGDHLLKAGVQYARLSYESRYEVQGNMYLLYTNGRPTSVREFNTPTDSINKENLAGFFVQDAWSVGGSLTLNLGFRFDHNNGMLPAQSAGQRQYVGPQAFDASQPISQNIAVWRTGASFDPIKDGRTAIKASYSRYGLQVGIDRVTNVNPLSATSQTCPWTDPNGDGVAQVTEIQQSQCSGFPGLSVHYAGANGPSWPYSDEVTAGVEREVVRNMRVGVMYYYRTNRNQIGTTNTLVPSTAYTPFTFTVPNGPGGTIAAPKPVSVTVYNLQAAFNGLQNSVIDNQPYLDTKYQGVEFTAAKRFSQRWQMVTGLTFGKNTGGINSTGGQSATISSTTGGDLNDPNFVAYSNGIIGNDSKVAFRLSGSYVLPYDISVAGSLVSNNGYPYVSTYSVSRAAAAATGVALTRSTQTVLLSERGAERLPDVTLVDLRFSRSFKFGQRRIAPQFDIYNLTNAYTITGLNNAVGNTYLYPQAFVSPRIMRVGVAVNF